MLETGKEGSMKRIVLDMQCAMFADAISQALERSDPDFNVLRAEAPEKTAALCRSSLAYALIMEVTGYPPWRLEERLRLRNEVKRQRPDCKILLLVDENADRALAFRVLQAKKDGRIDNFIYASVSPTYLAAVLDTL
jgi:DNA-binding NarL/FixJ family response regulator